VAVLTFRVLGTLAVLDGDRETPLTSGHQRRLLTALVLYAGRPVPVGTLVDALWEEEPPPSAPGTLQAYVSRLRTRLGRDSVKRTPDGYQLTVPAEVVDAARFEALAERVRSATDPATQLRLLDEALGLWRGVPFADLPHFPPALAEAARLTELRETCREERAEALLALHRFAEAAADLHAMTVAHPLRERPWRLLMLALHRSGRQAEAVAAFRRYDTLLAEEGLAPSSSIAALRNAILATPDSVRPPEPTSPPPTEVGAGAGTPLRPPRPAGSLVGRDEVLANLLELLRQHRLVTLTGPAGVGKSRLAVEAAGIEAAAHLDGASVVSLAPVGRDAEVRHAVAAELGISLAGSAAGDRLTDALTGWDLLLVLDNAEHVLAGVAALAAEVLRRCPGIVLLVTSQERVAIPAEQVRPVPPLAADGTDSPAVRLFRERATAANPGRSLGPDELAVVAALCEQLDGLPLALEMAAARTSSYTPRDLLDHMDRRFSLLRGVRATEGDRHATLRAAVDWSYRLLGPAEQELFAVLAAFPATFDAEAAASVSGWDPDAVRQGLATLVDRSMLTADLRDETARFGLLETLRAYGTEVLHGRGEFAAARTRHAAWATAFAERADAGLRGPAEGAWVARLDVALPHLRAAYALTVSTRDVATVDRLTTALLTYTYHRLVREPADWAAATLDAFGGDAPASVAVLAAVGHINRGDLVSAERLAQAGRERLPAGARARLMAEAVLADAAVYRGDLDQALPYCRDGLASDDPYLRALAHQTAGTADAFLGRTASAREHAAHGQELWRQTGAPSIRAWSDYLLGETLAATEPLTALRHLDRAVTTARQAGNRLAEGVALVAATACRARHGEPRAALAAIAGAIGHWQRHGDWTHQWPTLRTAAILLSRLGRHEAAVTISRAVAASAPPAYGWEAADLDAVAAAAASTLGPGGFAAAEAAGAALGAGGAVSYALTAVADDPKSQQPWH
jgi:predicted ATPase/DNA-binding SARP family transcriptional activator